MKHIHLALVAGLLAAAPTFGQCSLNPLTTLAGPWNFTFQGTLNELGGHYPTSIAGQFTASAATATAGTLRITATRTAWRFPGVAQYEFLTLQESGYGRYVLNDDCRSGGLAARH